MTMDSHNATPQGSPCFWPHDLDELCRAAAALEGLRYAAGAVYPQPSGWRNGLTRSIKSLLARLLTWHTPPLRQFDAYVSRSVQEIVCAIEHLSMNMLALDHLSLNMVALEARLAQSEKRNAALAASIEARLDLLDERLEALPGLQKIEYPVAPAGKVEARRDKPAPESSRLYTDTGAGNDRTAYVIGLFGTGRHYVNQLMRQNIGERAKYYRDTIRLHPGPTPMIYSGHATIRHVSRAQVSPEVMSHILEAASSGFADVIFIYRHPLDSLLTNWIWWRTYLQHNRRISGISEVYKSTDDLCADLERNFFEFKAFADGDPDFFSAMPGPPFLSFPEFVEETDLHLQSATLALRLEDFMADPFKEFSKIVEVMSVELDSTALCVTPPRTKPFGYLVLKDKVPRFRSFIDRLDAETKGRIEKIGYPVRG
jgi:hypothetical protein